MSGGATTYFDMVRSLTRDPGLLRAIDRVQYGPCPTCKGKCRVGFLRRPCRTCIGDGVDPARIPVYRHTP